MLLRISNNSINLFYSFKFINLSIYMIELKITKYLTLSTTGTSSNDKEKRFLNVASTSKLDSY